MGLSTASTTFPILSLLVSPRLRWRRGGWRSGVSGGARGQSGGCRGPRTNPCRGPGRAVRCRARPAPGWSCRRA